MDMNINEFIARALEATAQAGISPAEVSCSISDAFSVRARNAQLEDYKVSEKHSITLRGKVNGRIGTARTQALDEDSLALLIQGVRESAELIETEEQDEILPPDERYETVVNFNEALEGISAQEKIALALGIDQLMQGADARIKPDDTVVATSCSTFTMKNSLGLDLSHRSNMIYSFTSALAKDGDRAATGFKLHWGYGMDAIKPEALAAECQEDALSQLYAGRMKSGKYPVVIKGSAMSDLLSTFCGIFSAENAQKGMSLLAGKEGETIASACVTLRDDPLMDWGLASSPFDREGAATFRKNVIEGGVLKTLLHNRKTAKKAGCKTTGNAAGAGQVAPTNFYFVPGEKTEDALLAQLGDGLYLTEVTGLHAGANGVSGDFSLLSKGFEVKGGKKVRAVEQFTVAGNFYQLMKDILEVGAELKFEGSPIASPAVLVREISVAGED
ncbi:MAG: TldD/PmbA family protein [Clostridia bacterium]|nr:TldD/PmbA family protein [Clostridia bacterium]